MGALTGKVGIVTGAGRGIGAALAKYLAAEGAAVVVNDCDAEAAGEVVTGIAAAGGQATANFDSVSSWDGAFAMVAQAVAAFGRIDFVVNNAGIVRDVMFHKMSEGDWDAVIDVHLKGTFCVCRAAAERFRAQGSGAIVNMTSTSGLIGNLGQANYSAAKLGIVALTRSIALDMQRFGVRANAVAPFAWTRMTATIPATDDPKQLARIERLKQMVPEQIAPLVAFLVADSAKDVNGQVFAVRGTEITLFALPKPQRSLHRAGGWDVASLAEILPETLKRDFVPLQVTGDVFGYAPLL
jgi:NAD(P)-dependent dehydrogenase (short-subunit alcohol dehydrogenase family)